jgi:uncharacterized protein DUF6166
MSSTLDLYLAAGARDAARAIEIATECDVRIVAGDGRGRALNPRLDLRNHSPTGFNWGYGGSGPAQLALAILAHFTGNANWALRHYQDFKAEILAGLHSSRFELTATQLIRWIGAQPETEADQLTEPSP